MANEDLCSQPYAVKIAHTSSKSNAWCNLSYFCEVNYINLGLTALDVCNFAIAHLLGAC